MLLLVSGSANQGLVRYVAVVLVVVVSRLLCVTEIANVLS